MTILLNYTDAEIKLIPKIMSRVLLISLKKTRNYKLVNILAQKSIKYDKSSTQIH